ncbi:hypothetical protein BH09PLA1_BH09PLA1_19820 [soil metagenome]
MLKYFATIVIGLAFASIAQAVTYNLTSEFSDANNPNGVWSYRRGTTLLPHNNNAGANAINAVATNGFWGDSSDYNSTVFRTTGPGSAASGYNDNDFLAGDVVAHSTNPSGSSDINVTWTAPGAGSIQYSGAVWYAHSPVTRSNDFMLTLNNLPPLASGTVGPAQNRPNAMTFNSGGFTSVAAGDELLLYIRPTAGQQFGSLAGLSLVVNFTPIPEPASIALMTATAGAVLLRRRRRIS